MFPWATCGLRQKGRRSALAGTRQLSACPVSRMETAMAHLSQRERCILEELEQQLSQDTALATRFESFERRLTRRARHVRLGAMLGLWAVITGLVCIFVWAGAAALVLVCLVVVLGVAPLWCAHRHIAQAEQRVGGTWQWRRTKASPRSWLLWRLGVGLATRRKGCRQGGSRPPRG